jgi:hypothetical protein
MAQEFEHATVLYRPGEARTFAKGETIPAKSEGWADEPFPPTDEELGLAQSDGSLIGFAGVSAEAHQALSDEVVRLTEGLATAEAERDGLKIERDALKAQVAKFDKDGNGQPGGSKPKGA